MLQPYRFILVGASLYSWLGHSVQLSIREGDTVQIENILPVTKPFDLKLDKFYIEFHHDGSPAQYYADLQVLEGDKTTLEKTIKVNYPLVYNGVKFYQSSYGYLTEVLVRDGEETPRTLLAQDGDFIPFDNTGRTLKVFPISLILTGSRLWPSQIRRTFNPGLIILFTR